MRSGALRLVTVALLALLAGLTISTADAATVVALGASNTYGKGVARNQAFPAQLVAKTGVGDLHRIAHAAPQLAQSEHTRLALFRMPVPFLPCRNTVRQTRGARR